MQVLKPAVYTATIKQFEDWIESVTRAEPLIIGEDSPRRIELNDLALKFAEKFASLGATLPVSIRRSLADAVRSMNCYYSNLIEGHDVGTRKAQDQVG
ncbi:hypothetical protein A9Q96_09620 [Rhodobacterales bacterium 52_120_T64]|nr:hypothetical protein A9Q96_09620 [Rhodobacterales bacterium 52_120_T64]